MITATNGTITRTFTCQQYALAGGSIAGWDVIQDTCGRYTNLLRSPFASFGIDLGESERGRWYRYWGTITAGVITLPTDYTLPTSPENVRVTVRRLQYYQSDDATTRDYVVNYEDHTIDFETALANLNGQLALVEVFR